MNDVTTSTQSKQGDLLLWVGAGLLISLGATWFLLSKPWATTPTSVVSIETPRPAAVSTAPRQTMGVLGGGDSSLDNPLRMAQLAHDAGMLIEPEDYSAWTLYARVLQDEPGNSRAMEGLIKVADDLVPRASVALEQGRYEDARRVTERILALLPGHEGALEIAKNFPRRAAAPAPIEREAEPSPAPAERVAAVERPVPAVRAEPAAPSVEPVAAEPTPAEPVAPPPDPVAETHASFMAAMAANRLLAPAGDNAREHVATLIALRPEHELTLDARRRLFDALMMRATQDIQNLDAGAANTWLNEADRLSIDPMAVTAARQALTDRLIAIESARPVSAADLRIANYVSPQYPQRALDRGLEGWVDVEFVVGIDGGTKNVTVAAASHDNFFRNEAVRAVEQWRFEPRMYMGQAIEQRSHTRIRFAMN